MKSSFPGKKDRADVKGELEGKALFQEKKIGLMLRESLEGKTDRQRHFISRNNCCPSRPQLGRHSFQKKEKKS